MLLFSKLHSISGPLTPLASRHTDYPKSPPDSSDAQQN